ncbi:hypothetical protein KZO37_21520 [Rhodococcus fascians]|uniref:hypothetical protein n=1 Tax=Rhodococcoides fascians TaxID=1828 RepID=UPI001C5F1187|nr:hypothetical protein [Rhodococcus fascians]MBW4781945.1 hypothetical protein [Rhodococcus fascians]
MDIATASAGHQKALDLLTEEPTLDHLEQYDAAASIYEGLLGRRINAYLRVGIAGFVVLAALYFALGVPPFPGIFVVWVWVIGIMVPITWSMRWVLMVRKLVVSAHVLVDTLHSPPSES